MQHYAWNRKHWRDEEEERRQTGAEEEKLHQEIHQSAVSNRCQRGNHVMDGTEPESTLKTSNSSVEPARPLKPGPCPLTPAAAPGEASRGRGRAVQTDRWVHNQPPSPQLMKTSHTPPSGTSDEGRSSGGTWPGWTNTTLQQENDTKQ